MRSFPLIQDPVFERKQHGALNRFLLEYIRDERDLPFVYLSLKITFTLLPSALLLFSNLWQDWLWWAAAVVHLVLCALIYLGPFTLMLHNTSHRPFFKKEVQWMNKYIPWVLGPFMGQSPELYFIHHLGMHHSEGNMPNDRSSTMHYQRDSFLHFMSYFLRFMFIGVFELVDYFRGRSQKNFVQIALRGEFLYWTVALGLSYWNAGASLFVFILPLIIVRFGMMSGNWAQHAFVDKDNPDNEYKNSLTCINSRYNRICFNDGYHIGHHLYPNMHWTDMPGDFEKNKLKYAEQKALVFEGIDFHYVWFALMCKRYDWLANCFVNIDGRMQREELLELMRARTQQFSKEELSYYSLSKRERKKRVAATV